MMLENLTPVSAPLPWQGGQWQEIHNACLLYTSDAADDL